MEKAVTSFSSSRVAARVAAVPREAFKAVAWIGPMLMLLGEAIGSGELLTGPVAGARYGAVLFWVIIFTVVSKAFWNEAIGRVSLVTGKNFLEICLGAGPRLSWIPWVWYAVNVVKDFVLRGSIVAIAGLVCYNIFGPLPNWLLPPSWAVLSFQPSDHAESEKLLQSVAWTGLNFVLVWFLLTIGGYRTAERINTVLTIVFTVCLVACAALVLPTIAGDLALGLVPRIPSGETGSGGLLMIVALAGFIMAGSGTVRYSAWAEERHMGLYKYRREKGLPPSREEMEPESEEEINRMRGWLRVNRINIFITYLLGGLVCASTFILGVGILRPAGVNLTGPNLTMELSLMMTEVWGGWARGVFYLGTWAAIISTAISVFDGAARMYTQPFQMFAPKMTAKVPKNIWNTILITFMMGGSWVVYTMVPEPTTLVLTAGILDAPLVGIWMLPWSESSSWPMPIWPENTFRRPTEEAFYGPHLCSWLG